MAVDMFLSVKGIEGESKDKGHPKEMDVLAWSWGLTQSADMHVSSGGSGKVSIQDISVTKYVDKASPNLIQYCCDGTKVPEAKLTIRKAGGDPLEYIKITLKDVVISSVNTGGSSGEDRLTENVTLNFADLKYEYTTQDKSTATTTWNIPANAKTA